MSESIPDSEYRRLGPPVGLEAAGSRVDAFLGRAFPFRSRTTWAGLCWAGAVRVNGRPVRPARRLTAGDRLDVHHPLAAEPEVMRIELIGEAPGVIAVYKPASLPMHEHGDFRRRTFLALVAERFGPEWFPLHRLDVDTSGVVVCAATHALRSALCLDFRDHRVAKEYALLVHGRADWGERVVDVALAKDESSVKPRYAPAADGLTAETYFRVEACATDAAWLSAEPRTGRTNQIRVHAAWMGHPLLGDGRYGGDVEVAPRQMLHARRVEMLHPETKRSMVFEAPVPDDMRAVWQRVSMPGD